MPNRMNESSIPGGIFGGRDRRQRAGPLNPNNSSLEGGIGALEAPPRRQRAAVHRRRFDGGSS